MQASIVVGMFFGDEGKGTTVDYLANKNDASMIVRYSGGAQAAHYVHSPDGKKHCFSQFGSSHTPRLTYLAPNMIIEPFAMINEAEALKTFWNTNPLGYLKISTSCLITTPLHMLAGKAKEYNRGRNCHGTCGFGIGETRRISREEPEKAIRVIDIFSGTMHDKLKALSLDIQRTSQIGPACPEYLLNDYVKLTSPSFIDELTKFYLEWIRGAFKNCFLVRHPIAPSYVIFESSQGVLLDESLGFHPYTTWSTVSSKGAFSLLDEMYIRDYEVVGVMRTHLTRHGDGPLVLPYDSQETISPDEDNATNKYQKKFRFAPFDLQLAKYAVRVCPVDRISLTHCDLAKVEDSINISDYNFIFPRTIEDQVINTGNYKWGPIKLAKVKELGEDIIHVIREKVCGVPLILSYGKMFGSKVERT